MLVKQPKFTRVGEPTLLCNHHMKHFDFLILLLESGRSNFVEPRLGV
jgi:hypothetical protein